MGCTLTVPEVGAPVGVGPQQPNTGGLRQAPLALGTKMVDMLSKEGKEMSF